MLARYQWRLSVLFITGYFALKIMVGLRLFTVDPDSGGALTSLVGNIIFYWFMRHRSTDTHTSPPSAPGDFNAKLDKDSVPPGGLPRA